VSAWSNTKNSTTAADAYIEKAYLASYSGGLGVTNRDGVSGGGDTYEGTIAQTSVPGHTLDNAARYDSMLFDFGAGKSFQLKSVTVGWWQTDSDLTILAYTGTGTRPSPAAAQARLFQPARQRLVGGEEQRRHHRHGPLCQCRQRWRGPVVQRGGLQAAPGE
jgi:hypothetical protein